MAATYQQVTNIAGFSVSSLANGITLTGGSNSILIAIVTTYETAGTPKTVSSIIRAGQSFTEATALRQTLNNSAARFPEVKVFIYYLLAPATGGIQTTTVTLSGTAGYAAMSVFQLTNAYQAAPQDIEVVYDAGISGAVGITSQLLDTQPASAIMNQVNLFRTSNGGNGFNPINAVNLTTVSSDDDFSLFWSSLLSMTGTSGDFETNQSIGWNEVITTTSIAGDYVFVALEIQDENWTPSAAGIDPATYCPYVSRGEVRKMVTTISGLDHLEGETIKVQVDGVLPEGDNAFLVTDGTITLPEKAAVVHTGLGYDGTIVLLKSSDGVQAGTGQGRYRRVSLAVIRLLRSLGLKVGTDEDHLDPVLDEEPALPLITSDVAKRPDANWENDTEMILKMEDPLPCQILAVILEAEVEGRK